MTEMQIRDASLFVDVIGDGYPLLLMHGGPGADHWTMLPFRRLADQFTLIFYDHRCNGRSTGTPVESMTWENLTADADALREKLGFKRWAVLGHSFGGHVALEYALRYPDSVSHSRWSTRAETVGGRGRTLRRSSSGAATAPRRWSWSGASSTGRLSQGRCSRP
jgi:pimeloyl-ACP methyl ester carboxylesterase